MWKIMRSVAKRLRARGLYGTLRYSCHRFSEWRHERRLGIMTGGFIRQGELGGSDSDMREYEAVDYGSLHAVLNDLTIRSESDVLLDYGAGKGRVVVVAATYPFCKVIGVEISSSLATIARQNIGRARRHFKCCNVSVVTGDARTFPVPPEVTVVFLYNPFGGQILEAVLARIRQSLLEAPRKLSLIYKYPATVGNLFDALPWLVKRRTYRCYTEYGETVVLYEAAGNGCILFPRAGAPA